MDRLANWFRPLGRAALAGALLVPAPASLASEHDAVIGAIPARANPAEPVPPDRNRHLLRLAAGDWDPLSEASPPPGVSALPAPLKTRVPPELAGEAISYWLLQEGGDPRVLRQALGSSTDLEIVARVPNAAWLVRLHGDPASRFVTLPGLRWVGEWSPAMKTSSRLNELLAGGEPAPDMLDAESLRLHLAFQRGVSIEGWRATLEAVPGLSLRAIREDPQSGSEALVRLRLDRWPAGVSELARMRDLLTISIDELPHPTNDDQSVAVQSGIDSALGDFDLGAPFFRRGISGQGFSISLADDGLENDLAAFRYDEGTDEAAWQVQPDRLEPEGTTLDAARTRLRKVNAYIVLNGAYPYSSVLQHGTQMASVAVGDSGGGLGVLAARPLVSDLGDGQALSTCESGGSGWTVGELLRPDLQPVTDDPPASEPGFSSPFGDFVQHHDELDGVAPAAQLVMQDIGTVDGALSGVLFGFQAIDLAKRYGSTVHTAGYGGGPCDTCYAGAAPGTDRGLWVHRVVLKTHAAGNEGRLGGSTVLAGFAQAKNVIVVGATTAADAPSAPPALRNGEDVAAYSSRGPKSGGLLAPELVAPGDLRVRSSADVSPEDGSGRPVDAGIVVDASGTSYAAASVAGAAVLVQQYFWDGWYPLGERVPEHALRPTNALVRAVLVNSARNLKGARTNDDGTGPADRPSHGQGWGRPVLDDTLYFQGDPVLGIDPLGDLQRAGFVVLTDTPNGVEDGAVLTEEPGGLTRAQIVEDWQPALTEGSVHEYSIEVANPDVGNPAYELRITMAYTDIDGASVAGRTTVNDVDLEVVSPSGVVYRTNPDTSWAGGYSLPAVDQVEQEYAPFVGFLDFPDRDDLNMVENVFLRSADVEEGTWRLRVVGYDVPGNGRVRNDMTPNFVLNDNPPTRDTSDPCDGIPDVDTTDVGDSRVQGYALVVSGGVRPSILPCGDFQFPGPVRVSLGASCGFLVEWERAVGAHPPVTYELYRSDSLPVPLDAAHLLAGGLTGLSYRDIPPTPGPWHYRAVAEDSCDDPAPRRSANEGGDSTPAELPPLLFPGLVTATPEGECALRVSWSSASGHGDIVYDLYRSESLPVDRSPPNLVAADVGETNWLDEGWHEVDVHYRAVARDSCDEIPNAGGDSGPARPVDSTPPEFAGIVDTRDLGYCEVEVSWDEATASDSCSGIGSYNVYRDHGVGHRGETLVASGVPGSPYIDTTPGNGTWVYVVRAVDGADNEEQNEVFQQESENSCTNDFPGDAGMDDENGVDPPNGDGGNSFTPPPGGDDLQGRLEARIERSLGRLRGNETLRIAWTPSPDEGGLYPVTYSVLRGDLFALSASGYSHVLATPDACGITEHETALDSQVDGGSYYYLIVAVSGDNATYGYDHLGAERPEAPVCE